jgi:hypothetical protein
MVSDAVPKKRGPKTDVLEALLKRVNGLEERLNDETKADLESESTDEASKLPNKEANDVAPATETRPHEKWRENSRDDLPKVPPVAERILLYEIPIHLSTRLDC